MLTKYANFENAELDYKEREKKIQENNQPKKKSTWEIKMNPWYHRNVVFKLLDSDECSYVEINI